MVAALDGVDGLVDVVGEGRLADHVRRLLAGRLQPPGADGRPAAVVETTGSTDELARALERVGTLGTIVLAGPAATAPVALDLYTDLHVRGLVVVGVPGEEGSR